MKATITRQGNGRFDVYFGRYEGTEFVVSHASPSRSYKTAKGAARAAKAWTASEAEKIADAETNSSRWLGNGNAALEAGKNDKAKKCFDKAQFWLDRVNRLRGNC